MSISKLLEDPFGPYPDAYILNPEWPRRGHTRPTLTSVQMRCAGSDIGLDETELLDEAPSTSRFVKNATEVMGVLDIEKLDWLSDKGRLWLEFDLRKRDNEKSTAARASQLTLEAVYGDGVNSGSMIQVWVKFDKVMSAAYMTLKDDPTSLVLFAKDRNRSFRVGTLDVRTFVLSRKFIERYTLRRLIHELIDGCDTPIHDRTIEWLVEQYSKQVVPMDKYIRYIYNPNIAEIVTNPRGALKLPSTRHPRPVHKAEIRRIFASHAEWILADQIAALGSPNARYLDIPQWHHFVTEVKILFDKPAGVGTGGQHHTDRDIDVAGSLTKFGGKREVWKKRLENAIGNPLHWQQRRELEKEAQRTSLRDALSARLAQSSGIKRPSPKPPIRPVEPPTRPRIVSPDPFHYDSDFSDASITNESDSESETDDLQLVDRVPWYCREPPALEASQHVWLCPGCRIYQIDLLHLDEDELEEIPSHYADMLKSKNWQKVTDPEVLKALGHLVSNHYAEHLRGLGIQFVTEGDKVSVRKFPDETQKIRRRSRRLNRT